MKRDRLDVFIQQRIGKNNVKWVFGLFAIVCVGVNFLVTNIGPKWIDQYQMRQEIQANQNNKVFIFRGSHITYLPDSFFLLDGLEEIYLSGNSLPDSDSPIVLKS